MVRSMTGFGRARAVTNGREITVEIRSVNHRYFEFSCRVPRSYAFLEERLKAETRGCVSRGKLEVGVTITDVEMADTELALDLPLAKAYADALARIGAELSVRDDVSAGMIARMPDVLTARRAVPDEDALWADVKAVLGEALAAFVAMRETEGRGLRDDILSRLSDIEGRVAEIEAGSAERLERYRERLFNRMKTVLEDTNIDENRILLEAAIYADKSAVDEETVRLRSHIGQYRSILDGSEPVGRKLDFLTQELNREINTIGSKANDLGITAAVVDVKAEIEKIREQIQNLE